MKIQKNHNYFTIAIYTFVTAVAIIICYLILSNLKGFGKNFTDFLGVFTPFIWGISIAYVLNPLMKWIERHLSKIKKLNSKRKVKRGISVVLTMLFFLVLLYSFFAIVIPTVSSSVGKLIANLSFYYNNVEKELNNFAATYLANINLTPEQTQNAIRSIMSEISKLSDWLTAFLPKTFSMAISLTGKLTNVAIAFIVSIYLLASKENFLAQLKKILYAFTNTAKTQYALDLANRTNKIFNGYVSGSILDSIIVGVICFIVLTVLKIEYAALISLIVGVTNIIPFFGPFIGAIPSAILLLLISPKQCLIFIIIILILQQSDGNIIKPKILGQTTGLASFWVIFAVSVGGSLFGVLGMFVGVPVFAVIYTLFKEFVENRLQKKNLSPNTVDYREDLPDRFPIPDRIKENPDNPPSNNDNNDSNSPADSPAQNSEQSSKAENDDKKTTDSCSKE